GGHVLSAIYSADGVHIVTAGEDATVRVWRAKDGALLRVLRGHADRVVDVAISPDGTRIATGGADSTARLWSVSGKLLHVLPHRGPVARVRFSPDGNLLATASGDEMARIWRVDNGRLARTLKGHTDFVRDLRFRSGGEVAGSAPD